MKSPINSPMRPPNSLGDQPSAVSLSDFPPQADQPVAGKFPIKHFTFHISRFKFSSAFTLVELLAVITIITILAAMVVGGASFALRKASIARCNANMEAIKNAIADYQIDYGSCPPGNESALYVALCNGAKRYLKDPTCVQGSPAQLVDPWGNPYKYQAPGIHNIDSCDLWSWGPNGRDDSASGGGDDIANWTTGQ